MVKEMSKDITVSVVSRDPFFLFAARALLGRDRRARIFNTEPSVKTLRSHLDNSTQLVDAVVCDTDGFGGEPAFYADLRDLVEALPGVRVLCLAEGDLKQIVTRLEDLQISALLAKRDLGYCLHLAVRAAVDEGVVLVTKAIRALLTSGSTLDRNSRTIGPEKDYPNLTRRIEEITMWRIFIGLDNPDIQDELLLGKDTVREYVSKAYKALGASSEIEAFDALSNWWWVTRFSQAVR